MKRSTSKYRLPYAEVKKFALNKKIVTYRELVEYFVKKYHNYDREDTSHRIRQFLYELKKQSFLTRISHGTYKVNNRN